MRIGGIVLCGGHSRRMGAPKATLPFGSELMLQRVVRLLNETTAPIAVVAAPDQKLPHLPDCVLLARDERKDCGPLEGIRAGMQVLWEHADAAYVTSCDVPLLEGAFVRRMIDLLGTHEIAVPVDGNLHHPLAAVYRLSCLPKIESLLEQHQLRVQCLFDLVATNRVSTDDLRRYDPQLTTLWNLNCPEDYFAALKAVDLCRDDAHLRFSTRSRHG